MILPMDDLRHCPAWLRVLDQPIKATSFKKKEKMERVKPESKPVKNPRESIVVAYDENGVEAHKGTYLELSLLLNMTVAALKNYAFRETMNKETRLRFKVVESRNSRSRDENTNSSI